MNQIDTIAAIATGLGNSSIGIVRISGSEAVKIADKVYRSKKVKKRTKLFSLVLIFWYLFL